jgi:hypothetical protein
MFLIVYGQGYKPCCTSPLISLIRSRAFLLSRSLTVTVKPCHEKFRTVSFMRKCPLSLRSRSGVLDAFKGEGLPMLQDNVDGLRQIRENWNPTHVQVRGPRFYNFKPIHIICTWTHGLTNPCLASRQSPCYVSEVVPEVECRAQSSGGTRRLEPELT